MPSITSSVQFSSVAQSCPTLCDPMDCSCSRPGFPVHHQLPELAQTHVHLVDDAIQPSHPLLSLLLLPSIFPSIRVFSNESVLGIRWPKYWNFSFSIISSNEHSGLISFRMDWLDLLALEGTFKSLLQHHSSKASILQCSAFFTVQLSHPYMTTVCKLPLPLYKLGFPGGSEGKESACRVGDPGLIPGSGISLGEGNGNPLQYSCLENPMDRGAWLAPVYGVARVGHV